MKGKKRIVFYSVLAAFIITGAIAGARRDRIATTGTTEVAGQKVAACGTAASTAHAGKDKSGPHF
jgi:hypothetical protein